jgi:hypothetical protein
VAVSAAVEGLAQFPCQNIGIRTGETLNAAKISWNWLKIITCQVNRGSEFGFFNR